MPKGCDRLRERLDARVLLEALRHLSVAHLVDALRHEPHHVRGAQPRRQERRRHRALPLSLSLALALLLPLPPSLSLLPSPSPSSPLPLPPSFPPPLPLPLLSLSPSGGRAVREDFFSGVRTS